MSRLGKKVVAICLSIGIMCGNLSPLAAGANTPLTETPVTEATPVAEPVPGVMPTVGETAETTFPAERVVLGEVLSFEQLNPMSGTMAGVFLTDLTDGRLVASRNSSMLTSASEVCEWLLPLYVLRNVNLQREVTITKTMLDTAKKVSYPVLAGLQENEKITVENLVLLYMMTHADDVRMAIVSAIMGSETTAVEYMNRLSTNLNLGNTKIVTSDGAYVAGQHTNAYDLYVIIRELLTHTLFADNYTKASVTVNVTQANGTIRTITAKNAEHAYSNLYGKVRTPEGYTFLARMSGGCATSGLAQVLLTQGPDGHIYMSVLTGIPFEKDISIESERVLGILSGETYVDQEQEIPFGDDTVRYDYLFGTDVVYYTIDNKPPGYADSKEAERYMMQITVPVWKLNDETGVRTASTMNLKVNRKMATGVRKIFQEIFELPIKFPIKKLSGYGYRKAGGVGLSNCTLMSVHSYGAAIDINSGNYDNDYFLGAGNDLRDKDNPYCIPDEVIEIFAKYGWYWGGNFGICVDAMHFQYLGLEFLTYQNNSPFMTVDMVGKVEVGSHIENLQLRLQELGYRVNVNGIYNEQTRETVRKFQVRHGLPATGVVDYKTWETVINLTHYMAYAF